MTPWSALVLAGLFELVFTTCMKLSENFTKPLYIVGFLLAAVFSFACLAFAMKTIPLGTSYAVWTGIGAFGTAVIGMIFFKDPISAPRIAFLLLLIGSILGLKFAE